jgi:hypothetical protein
MTTWFDVIVYALGWAVMTYLAWQLGKSIPRIAIALSRAISVIRWTVAIKRAYSLTGRAGFSWVSLFFWSFVSGLHKSASKISSRQGVWNGIGDWTVFPPKVAV